MYKTSLHHLALLIATRNGRLASKKQFGWWCRFRVASVLSLTQWIRILSMSSQICITSKKSEFIYQIFVEKKFEVTKIFRMYWFGELDQTLHHVNISYLSFSIP